MKKYQCISASLLKILAMAFMLCDHLWGTGVLPWSWLTTAGRMAFPIFAFQIAEGYAHTHDFKAYLRRLLIFALISEIPFNLMMGGSPGYLLDQNVMFTFAIALVMIRLIDRSWARRPALGWKIAAALGFSLLGYLLGFLTLVDYYGFGVLMVILFWLTREKRFGWLLQLAGMWVINWQMMGGLDFRYVIFGREVFIPQQAFAILALIPIWLYNGQRGRGGKKLQYFGYLFYPLHMLALYCIAQWMLAGA